MQTSQPIQSLVPRLALSLFSSLVLGCVPCPELHCPASDDSVETPAPHSQAITPSTVFAVVVTLDSISRLTTRWRMRQGRNRGARRGAVVETKDGQRALVAVSALPSPLRVSADPSCDSCVVLQGSMPLVLELGTERGAHSELHDHPARLLASWTLAAELQATWARGSIEVRAIPKHDAQPAVALNWRRSDDAAATPAALPPAVRQEALELAGRVVTAEAIRAAAELVLLQVPQWPGAAALLPQSALSVQMDGPLLRLLASAPLGGDGIEAKSIRPGVSQDLVIAVATELLQRQSYDLGSLSAPPAQGGAQRSFPVRLLSLDDHRRALRYRLRAVSEDGSSWFELRGEAQPGRRGANPTLRPIDTPRLVEAGGGSGRRPPDAASRNASAQLALQPVAALLGRMHAIGPGDTAAGLLLVRQESGAVLLESVFRDRRGKPPPGLPPHQVRPAQVPRLPVPKHRAADPSPPQPSVPTAPWAHPAPQSDSPSTR